MTKIYGCNHIKSLLRNCVKEDQVLLEYKVIILVSIDKKVKTVYW